MIDDHLPECLMYDVKVFMCICLELRRCEERVEESMDRAWEKFSRDQFDAGYAVALDTAREAVASMEIAVVGNSAATVDQALAAIDALREDSETPPLLPPSVGVPERRWK